MTTKDRATPEQIIKRAQENHIEIVDFKFVDLPGTWQHISIPVRLLTEKLFEDGISFDGSSIPGFREINESDMLLLPDPDTAFIDPFFTDYPHMGLICNVAHPTKEPYDRDPRYVAKKAEDYLHDSKIADIAYFGPEAEFYIFDSVRYLSTESIQYAQVDSAEAHWNSKGHNDKPDLGHFMHVRGGHFPVPPQDTHQGLRTEMLLNLEKVGIEVEAHHHEVGAAGQAEIRMHYDTLIKAADNVLLYKYVTKNTAHKHGKTVTFMPKPVFGDNGSGMHTHQSLWKDGRPLFYDRDSKYADLSQLALYYIGGILEHTPAILAIAAPTTNSYKRLVPGFEAPVNRAYSEANRSAAIRIPKTTTPEAKRIEYRPPDPTANPYLLFSALLLAGLDGIRQKKPPLYGPQKENMYKLSPDEQKATLSVPNSLEAALAALEKDHSFLLEGGVFTDDLLKKYIEIKREQAEQVRFYPVPIEFSLYYGS